MTSPRIGKAAKDQAIQTLFLNNCFCNCKPRVDSAASKDQPTKICTNFASTLLWNIDNSSLKRSLQLKPDSRKLRMKVVLFNEEFPLLLKMYEFTQGEYLAGEDTPILFCPDNE